MEQPWWVADLIHKQAGLRMLCEMRQDVGVFGPPEARGRLEELISDAHASFCEALLAVPRDKK